MVTGIALDFLLKLLVESYLLMQHFFIAASIDGSINRSLGGEVQRIAECSGCSKNTDRVRCHTAAGLARKLLHG